MTQKQQLVVICGPTATGKSALAVSLARKFNGEVISADSMQVYRGMDIGTAKPAPEEMRGVPHHMLDCADVSEDFSAAAYRDGARACIADVASRGKLPILCGGTGLYISAVVYALDFSNTSSDEAYRVKLAAYAAEHGNEGLHALLAQADPAAAASVHPNNVKRVIRALERVKAKSGETPSPGPQQLFNGEPLYDAAWIGLTMDRALLYRRIDARVDEMIARGLPEEVKALAGRFGRNSTALQAIGYKELLGYLDGKATLEQTETLIKQGTRRYAKRQLTWFRRERSIRWLDAGELSRGELVEAAAGYLCEILHIG